MSAKPTRRQFVCTSAAGLAAVLTRPAAADEPAVHGDSPARAAGKSRNGPFSSFYAMDTGLRGPDVPTLEKKVDLLKTLGYDGIDYTLNHEELPRLLDLLEKANLELSCVYLSPTLEDKPDPKLADSIKRMGGHPTRIEMALQSHKWKSSDPAGDGHALDLLKRVSDMAAENGPVVSIYPHTGSWAERVEDGVRLAAAADRKNVGTNFNLVHWKWVKQSRPLEDSLKEALPHLFTVSINGLKDNHTQQWTIVPLGQGDYDVPGFLALLDKLGYHGQVGLQGYGVPGNSADHLKQSIAAWRQMVRKLTA